MVIISLYHPFSLSNFTIEKQFGLCYNVYCLDSKIPLHFHLRRGFVSRSTSALFDGNIRATSFSEQKGSPRKFCESMALQ